MRQGDLFKGRAERQVQQMPTPEDVRARMNTILQELRTAATFPWTETELRSYRHIVHNMANWLPEPERSTMRQTFLDELARWEGA